MLKRFASATLSAATVLNGFLHHLPMSTLFALALVFGGCVLLIWFPEDVNEFTLGSWTRGAQIDAPTPAFLIAGFGWVVLLALSIVINLGLHRAA